jgi:hypothetical protein
MASKSVKFEISLKELKVSFEGDIQTAERLQGDITGALNTLASAQQRMLPAPPKAAPPAQVVVASGGARRRRRRKALETTGIDPAILDGATESTNGNGDGDSETVDREPRRTRRAGAGPRALLDALKQEGFFSQGPKTNANVREALARKGHTLKSNEVNPPLVAMTKEGLLQREKTPDDQWVYFDSR